MATHLRASLERRLERGEGVLAPAARVWSAIASRRLARRLAWPDDVALVAVGGATLGGSGKTPLAIACARALVELGGAPVALVGHGYRARPERARVVTPADDVAAVGDEAIACATGLARVAEVVVAPSRQQAIDFAVARGARVLVVDGLLTARPRRPTLALLAVDAVAPWGAGVCPPQGDLVASREALVRASDRVVAIDDASRRSRGAVPLDEPHAKPVPLAELRARTRRLGLATSIARPERLLRWLAAQGIVPDVCALGADHLPPRLDARGGEVGAGVDAWMTTAKCAAHLRRTARAGSRAPIWVVDHELYLGTELRAALAALVAVAGSLDPRGGAP